jgi:hypothetical protein
MRTALETRRQPSLRAAHSPDLLLYRIAHSVTQRSAAFRLVHNAYVTRGLIEPNLFELRVTPWHLLPTTQTFVASHEDEVVCTVSLIGDGSLGLPMEAVYPEVVENARQQRLYVGEVSCFATRDLVFSEFLPIFVQLTRLMAQHARAYGMHQFLIAVHPKHVRFYERYMGFEQVGPLRHYPSVQNAPAVACCLDFARVDRDRPRTYDDFFGTPLPRHLLTAAPMGEEQIRIFRPAAELAQTCLPVFS